MSAHIEMKTMIISVEINAMIGMKLVAYVIAFELYFSQTIVSDSIIGRLKPKPAPTVIRKFHAGLMIMLRLMLKQHFLSLDLLSNFSIISSSRLNSPMSI